jgi:hypothetical protein
MTNRWINEQAETNRQTYGKTDGTCKDRQMNEQTGRLGRKTHRQAETDRLREKVVRHTGRQVDREAGRHGQTEKESWQAGKHTGRQTSTQNGRQTGRVIRGKVDRQAGRPVDRQTG